MVVVRGWGRGGWGVVSWVPRFSLGRWKSSGAEQRGWLHSNGNATEWERHLITPLEGGGVVLCRAYLTTIKKLENKSGRVGVRVQIYLSPGLPGWFSGSMRGNPLKKAQNLFIKNCVFILTCSNFSHLQSTLHLMQYTYWDIFSISQNSFWTCWFWCFLVLLQFFVSPFPH